MLLRWVLLRRALLRWVLGIRALLRWVLLAPQERCCAGGPAAGAWYGPAEALHRARQALKGGVRSRRALRQMMPRGLQPGERRRGVPHAALRAHHNEAGESVGSADQVPLATAHCARVGAAAQASVGAGAGP